MPSSNSSSTESLHKDNAVFSCPNNCLPRFEEHETGKLWFLGSRPRSLIEMLRTHTCWVRPKAYQWPTRSPWEAHMMGAECRQHCSDHWTSFRVLALIDIAPIPDLCIFWLGLMGVKVEQNLETLSPYLLCRQSCGESRDHLKAGVDVWKMPSQIRIHFNGNVFQRIHMFRHCCDKASGGVWHLICQSIYRLMQRGMWRIKWLLISLPNKAHYFNKTLFLA